MTPEEMEIFLQETGLPDETNWIYGSPRPVTLAYWWICDRDVEWIESDIQETGYCALVAFPYQLNKASRNELVLLSNPASRAGTRE